MDLTALIALLKDLITGGSAEVTDSIVMHPVRVVLYGLWLASLAWFTFVLFRRRDGARAGVGR